MVKEFFTNYFALDSRFGRSFRPFFFKPGFLTDEFIKGKRMSYANPIRLYIVISIIHFFVFNLYFKSAPTDENDEVALDAADSTAIANELEKAAPLLQVEIDSALNEKELSESSIVVLDGDSAKTFRIEERMSIIGRLKDDYSVSTIYDSLDLDNANLFAQLTWKQIIKVRKEGGTTLGQYFLKNIPILMFFLLPLYALILKIFFHKRLYINHLVHSLHLHSFLFSILTFIWIAFMIWYAMGWLLVLTFLLLCFYIVLSFKRSYEISTRRAIWKLLGTGLIYYVVLGIAMFVTAALSFYTF